MPSGAEYNIRPCFYGTQTAVCDFSVIVIKNLMEHHFCPEFCDFLLNDRRKGIFDPAVINFISRCDNRCFFTVNGRIFRIGVPSQIFSASCILSF